MGTWGFLSCSGVNPIILLGANFVIRPNLPSLSHPPFLHRHVHRLVYRDEKWRIYAVSEASAGRETALNSQAEISKFKADSMSLQDNRFCPFEDNGYCPETCLLLKLANKSLSLYIFVSVLWFYLVLYVFHCPKSIDCTERCYQFVITNVLSLLK